MMDRIDRYILALLIPPFLAALAGAMLLLMLERMIRVVELVGEHNGSVSYVFDIMSSLIPHYLGLAIPAALFVACFVAFRRLANTSELDATASIGRGLGRLARPAFFFAALLTLISSLVHSNLQPHGRFEYRTLKFHLANSSITEALQSGNFAEFGDITFIVESGQPGDLGFGKVFVHQRGTNGSNRTITSQKATVIENQANGDIAIGLEEGQLLDESPDGQLALISFRNLDWPIDRKFLGSYKPRGWIESELTWPELLAAMETASSHLTADRIESELNARMARAFTCLLIPILAIPLAIAGRRKRSVSSIAIGVITLLVYVQSLKFIEETADLGTIPPALSIWSLYSALLCFSLFIFIRAWRGVGFEITPYLPAFKLLARKSQVERPT